MNNQNRNQQSDDDFVRNRGGHSYGNPNNNSFRGDRGGGRGGRSNYYNNRPGDNPHFGGRRGGYGEGRGRGGYGEGRERGGYGERRERGGYGERRERGGGGWGPRSYNNNFGNRGDFDRDRRGGGFYTNRNNYENQQNYRNNFNRDYYQNHQERDEEYEREKEAQYEKEKYSNEFKKKYNSIIEAFNDLFINESLQEEQIIQIIKDLISNPNLTIFEAMNAIYRKVQIIKTLSLNKNERQYGPNKDILIFEFEENLNRGYLRDVIQKYKIYKKEENNFENKDDNDHLDKDMDIYWYYVDDFDRRRKLLKDDYGMFNYLPIMNPDGKGNNNDEDDIYAKNENEILYHALFYKTLMCKECNISNNNNQPQLLCPYAHDILKDFRIIYKYTDEKICKFMLVLKNSSLFTFQNYLNYIPMSLKYQFNIDTFKVHKCQLDKDCPNDYHLCPYYHKSLKDDKQRRPPLLFGYSGTTGDICYNVKKNKYNDKECPCGIFCKYIHNKNEFNYHHDHFRKEFECKRQKDKFGRCIYLKTCYGKHNKEEENNVVEEEEEEVDSEEAEYDEEVVKKTKKVKNVFNVAKILRCRKCQNVDKGTICYFKDCKHFLCLNCYKIIYKENKKNIKNENNKNEVKKHSCPFCNKEIAKKAVIKIEFKEKKTQ